MGSNYTPSSLQSGFRSLAALNNEFQEIKDSIDRLLSRQGDSPNQMDVSLDMNSFPIFNLGKPLNDNQAARLIDVTSLAKIDEVNVSTEEEDVPSNQILNDRGFAESVSSVAALQSASFGASLERIWLEGFTGQGTPGGGPLYKDSSDTTSTDNGATIFVDADGNRWKAGPGFAIAAAGTLTVGSGGNYATLNDAFQDLINFRPGINTDAPLITLNILTGFVMAEQVFVTGVNLNWIKLTSDDAEVVIQRDALTSQPDPTGPDRFPAWYFGGGSVSPIIDVLFNMDSSGVATDRGGFIFHHSRGDIQAGAGCKNAGARNLHFSNSLGRCTGAIATGAGTIGLRAANGSYIWAEGVDVSNSGGDGIACPSSFVHARNAVCDNCVGVGARVSSSARFYGDGLSAVGCGSNGVDIVQGSTADLTGAAITGSTEFGLRVDASLVNASSATITGNTLGNLLVRRAGILSFFDGDGSSAVGGHNLMVDEGGNCYAKNANLSGSPGNAVFADDGSYVDVSAANATNATNFGVRCSSSRVSARSIDTTGSGSDGISVLNGGLVVANSAIGTLSQTANINLPSGTIYNNDVVMNSGTATISNTTTSVVISHGLDRTPFRHEIMAIPLEDIGSANSWWISSPTGTDFTLHVNADPGKDVLFGWRSEPSG